MTNVEVTLLGRSSSHFTRTARIFAVELEVPHHFRPVVLRGDVADRIVANAEELILHAMAVEVTLIMAALASKDQPPPPKLRPSLENVLRFLDERLDLILAALPPDRLLSFCETSLYCLVTHLPFRRVMDVSPYPRLQSFCESYGQRPGARATEYRFDAPPAA